jgi:xylulokinase
MEGCALRTLKLLDILSQNRLHPRALNIVGGGANSDVWNQIRADVFGLEIRKPAVTEATCLGTALFCTAALDKARSLPEISADWITVAKCYRPNPAKTRTYQKLARIFEEYIKTNSDLFRELSEFKR